LCGIIGYNGFRKANKLLIDCLKKLEYRGYDSAGVSIINKKQHIFKKVGEIKDLEDAIPDFNGNIGIGHTRWATHGNITIENAHPHLSHNRKIAVVHNGIIENFMPLKEKLIKKGYKFKSETDSEVIAHLIQKNYTNDLHKAVFHSLKEIHGYYAILVTCTDEPEIIIGAKKENPLVIGVGDNENFIASDITAFLRYTNRAIFLEDGEITVISKKDIRIFDTNNKAIKKNQKLIDWNIKDAEKSGFPHFMLKEIYDQPDSIHRVLRGRISEIDRKIKFNEQVEMILSDDIDSIRIVGCGSSHYAGLYGKYIMEEITGIPVTVDFSSEYINSYTAGSSSLLIALTQSGETLDTINALKTARSYGCRTLVITNVIESTATRISDAKILSQSGPEIGVAATKTFTAQILILFLLALKIGVDKNLIKSDNIYRHILQIKELPSKIRHILDDSCKILDIARQLKNAYSVFFIGRGKNYPLSLEGALKLKEISYIHAEGFPAGELKHGPFSLLTNITPVIAIVSTDKTYDKMISNIGEIKARGSQVIAIAPENDSEIEKYADFIIKYPLNSDIISCISIIVIIQLIAYHTANLRGCSIDKPRNLAKSVTVE
jgi:glucosamine--fructose-6-phosphate aminotransferase (isomerizing)